MVSVNKSGVNSSEVLKGEATDKAICLYRAGHKMFPGVDVNKYQEANWTLEEFGGATTVDKKLLQDNMFWDTVVITSWLPAVKNTGKEDSAWNIAPLGRAAIKKAFLGISYQMLKTEKLPMREDGMVLFSISLKTDKLGLEAGFELLQELKSGNKAQDGFVFKLRDVDVTSNFAGYVIPGFQDSLQPIYLDGKLELVPCNEQAQKKVGLQCAMWDKGDSLYFKVYDKLAFMLVSTGVNNKKGGSQLENILASGHPNIAKAFKDADIQNNGFARSELRFRASALPDSLDAVKEMLWQLTAQAVSQRVGRKSLDKSVQGYLAKGHQSLLLLEEQELGYKVVVVRWMDKVTGACNSQSISTAGIKCLPKTLEDAVYLGYQWVPGNAPVVAVVVGKDGRMTQSIMLPATGLTADIQWDGRKAADTQMVKTRGRGVSFAEVGMPSFPMEHPKKRVSPPREAASVWWAKGKDVVVTVVNKEQRAAQAREWAKVQNKQAKRQVAQMVGAVGNKLGKRVSLDKVKKGAALLVVKTGVDKVYGKELFLASDGNTYEFTKRMRDAGMHKLGASHQMPLIFVRGEAGKQKTVNGYKQYPDAEMVSWSRTAVRRYFPELDGWFYSAEEYVLYADVKM
jgi:hypothetical protein